MISLPPATPVAEKSPEVAVPELSVQTPPSLLRYMNNASTSSEHTVRKLDFDEDEKFTTFSSERDRVWTFLASLNVLRLRPSCREYKVSQKCKKKTLLQMLLRSVFDSPVTGSWWYSANIGKINETEGGERQYLEWIKLYSSRTRWNVAPYITPTRHSHLEKSNQDLPFP